VPAKKSISDAQFHRIAKALADPRRVEILRQVGSCNGALDGADLRDCQPVSAATLSHHLKELEESGLIRILRKGKFADLILERKMLQAYTDRLLKI